MGAQKRRGGHFVDVATLFPELFKVAGELSVALPGLSATAVGETAAEIDYKGMKPANVDACAKTAACVDGV